MVKESDGKGVQGELWEVDVKFLPKLDRVETSLFQRQPVKLSSHPKENVQAYIYIDDREGCDFYDGRNWRK